MMLVLMELLLVVVMMRVVMVVIVMLIIAWLPLVISIILVMFRSMFLVV